MAVTAVVEVQGRIENGRVLLIEDDPSLADMYALALEIGGVMVERASTAADGLRLGLRAWADVILLDIGLPDRSGLEVLQALRQDPEGGRASIIMFSNYDDPATIKRAFELGAAAFVLKSDCTPASLVRRVRSQFGQLPGPSPGGLSA